MSYAILKMTLIEESSRQEKSDSMQKTDKIHYTENKIIVIKSIGNLDEDVYNKSLAITMMIVMDI